MDAMKTMFINKEVWINSDHLRGIVLDINPLGVIIEPTFKSRISTDSKEVQIGQPLFMSTGGTFSMSLYTEEN